MDEVKPIRSAMKHVTIDDDGSSDNVKEVRFKHFKDVAGRKTYSVLRRIGMLSESDPSFLAEPSGFSTTTVDSSSGYSDDSELDGPSFAA
jgi:hypothetical protein